MKNFIISAIVLFSTLTIKAQITLERSFDSTNLNKIYCIDIGNKDFKYVLLHSASNRFSLYNMDMTPFIQNIALPIGDSIMNGFVVLYVSKALFDCDSTNIEFVYEYPADSRHPFRILRTDGTLLFMEDSATGPYCYGCYGGAHDQRPIMNTSAGTKLFLQKTDPTFSWSQLKVYSLCGSLPVQLLELSNHNSILNVFPNPTDMQINFEISPQSNIEKMELVIFDSNGNEQQREKVNEGHKQYVMNVAHLSSGSYFYSLISNNNVLQSGKFILTR